MAFPPSSPPPSFETRPESSMVTFDNTIEVDGGFGKGGSTHRIEDLGVLASDDGFDSDISPGKDKESSDARSVTSGVSGVTGVSSHSPKTMAMNGMPAYVDPVVAEKEQRAVVYSKLLVGLVLILAAAATSASMYLIVRNNEINDFESTVRNACVYTEK